DHEGALARPHQTERDLGAAERPTVHHFSDRARPVADPRRETAHHGATIAECPPAGSCGISARARTVAGSKLRWRAQPAHSGAQMGATLHPKVRPGQYTAQTLIAVCREIVVAETGFEPATARPPAGAKRLRRLTFGALEPFEFR